MFITVKVVGKYESVKINANNINSYAPYFSRATGRTYTQICMTSGANYLVEDSMRDISSKLR